jgi:acyl-CoA hydrolase
MAGPVKEGKGRPTVMTPEALSKIEEGAKRNYNHVQMALSADIGYSTFARYLEQNPDFREKIDALRNQPSMLAKDNVYNSLIDGDINSAKWQLENVDGAEYSKRQITETKEDLTVKFSDLGDVDKADASKIVGFVLGRIKK